MKMNNVGNGARIVETVPGVIAVGAVKIGKLVETGGFLGTKI